MRATGAQLALLEPETSKASDPTNLSDYDTIIVAFSGGKDSIACFLHLLDAGADPKKVELWHHRIDGDGPIFFDWAVTESYCEAFAKAFSVPIYFSWKEGGFRRELLRENQRTAPTTFQTPHGTITVGGTGGKVSTRRKFPQVTADLTTRWCSAYLKIDVCAAAIRNDPRFSNKRTLILSGERAEESPARARYNTFEPDRADNRNGEKAIRHVDRWRPVHAWTRESVWGIIERWKINPHPAYHLGFGRLSCMDCIFADDNQLASVQVIDPWRIKEKADMEVDFGCTIHRTRSIKERAAAGTAYNMDPAMIAKATSNQYTDSIFVQRWVAPAGAFANSTGPT